MTQLVAAVDAEELAGLEQRWGATPRAEHTLVVDHPFLSGQHQMLLGDDISQLRADGREKRRAEICYVMHQGDPRDGVLLHIKTIYPSGAFRLPTGGVQQGETVADTLAREMWEETGLTVDRADLANQVERANGTYPVPDDGTELVQVERFLGVVEYALAHHGFEQTYAFATYHFLVRMPQGAELRPQDASEMIGGWQWRPAAELGEVADGLACVGARTAQWADWGRYRALSHRFVLEQLAVQ